MPDDVERLVGEALVAWRTASDAASYESVTDALLAACNADADSLARRGLVMLASADAAERAVGCDAVGLVVEVREDWRDAVAPSVIALADDDNADVLSSVVGALGRCADVRAVPVLCQLAGHVDADVRFGVACALPFVMDDDQTGQAVDTLLVLAGDAEDDIREWALFGVGSLGSVDSRAIRRALRAGLEDPCEEVRVEAIHGLARRRDVTVVPLVSALLTEDDEPRSLTFAAAEYLGHPDLLWPLSTFDSADPGVRRAVLACDPVMRAEREDACHALVAGVQDEFDRRQNGFSVAVACPLLETGLELIVVTETSLTFGAFEVLSTGPTIDTAVAHVLHESGIA